MTVVLSAEQNSPE